MPGKRQLSLALHSQWAWRGGQLSYWARLVLFALFSSFVSVVHHVFLSDRPRSRHAGQVSFQ